MKSKASGLEWARHRPPWPALSPPWRWAALAGIGLTALVLGWLVSSADPRVQVLLLGAAAAGSAMLVAAAAWGQLRTAAATGLSLPLGGRVVDGALVWIFIVSSWSGVWSGPNGIRIADIVIVGLATYGLLRLRLRSPYVALLVAGGVLLVVGAATASLAGGEVERAVDDVQGVARLLFSFVVVPLVVIRFVTDERRLLLCLLAIVASALVASGAAVVTTVTDVSLLPFPDDFFGRRSYGLSTHPVVFGAHVSLAIPVAAGLLLSTGGRLRLLLAAALPLLAAGLVLTASRTAVIAAFLATAVALVGIVGWRRRRVLLIAGGALTVVVLIAGVVFSGQASRLVGDESTARSASTRLAIYDRMLTELEQQPLLGRGAGQLKGRGGLDEGRANLNVHALTGNFGDVSAHNVYAQVWLALGAVGLIGLCLIIVAGFAAAGSLAARPDRASRAFGSVLVAALICVVVVQLSNPVVFEREFWLVVGLALAAGANCTRPEWRSDRLRARVGMRSADRAAGSEG